MTTENQAPNPDENKPDAGKAAPAGQEQIGEAVKPTPVTPGPLTTTEPVEYEPTGDAGLDMALTFIGKAGIGPDSPAVLAAQSGDFSVLKALLAEKAIPGWEQYVALGEAAYKRTAEADAAKAAEGRAAIFKEAGGEEQWNAVKAWAGENATPEEKADINKQLAAGGLAAKTAVRYLVSLYERASNVVQEPKDATTGAGKAPKAAGPMGPREYAQEVQALRNKLGGGFETSKEYAALQQRRLSAMR